MALKYTFGVNAWRHWVNNNFNLNNLKIILTKHLITCDLYIFVNFSFQVVTKNAELEKQNTPTRKVKLFKTDLLQLTADELNYSLVLFVQEVRKPNGAEYAPDTIYYLCLGKMQLNLFL